MGISSPGIGSNLDVNGIVSKLMQAESAPLVALQQKEASYQARLSAFGTLSSALSSFKDAVGKLNTPTTFQSMSASVADSTIFAATATSKATAGNYSINVTQLAQAQTLSAKGVSSTTTGIGTGKLVFQFGTINGSIAKAGNVLGAGVAAGGISPGSLSINGTTIATTGSTNSAKALADQINQVSSTTGVMASAQTDSGALGTFSQISTGSYSLNIGGVGISVSPPTDSAGNPLPIDGTTVDDALTSASANLAQAGISFSGSASDGTLKFTRADGDNIAVQQTGAGGFDSIVAAKTFTGAVSLSSPSAITIGGNNPAAASLDAGTFTAYAGATFTQDANQTSGEITIDPTNSSLQGIRDAINKANLGVTATIVSDGSASPYHLVLTSNKTGAASSMKIDVQGDAALSSLLTYDPAGAQNMTQTSAAQSAALTVNGIAVTSETNSVSGAIEGVSLNLSKTGSTSLNVKLDTSGTQSAVSALVKAYNDLHATIKAVSGYNADTKQGGVLIGDSTVRDVDFKIRQMLSSAATGSNSSLTTLSQIGISIDKTGNMMLDSSKLSSAMTKNMDDITALFSSMGKTTDSLISFDSTTTKTTPGTYDVTVTQLATRGSVTGNKNLRTVSTPIDNSNKDFSVTVDGTNASISLLPGASYSATQIAAQLQSAINSAPAFSKAGISVSVTVDNTTGYLSITSNRYGSASKVSISGSGVSNLMGTPSNPADGKDVAGTIGGTTATGSGQYLTGTTGSAVEGLKLLVNGGTGINRGTITFSQGYAFHLNNLLGGFVGSEGLLAARTDGINSTIKDIGKQTDAMNTRLTNIEKRYRAQFTALDTMLSSMTSTSTYLTQQLAQIKANA